MLLSIKNGRYDHGIHGILLGVGLELVALMVASLDHPREAPFRFILLYGLAFVGYLVGTSGVILGRRGLKAGHILLVGLGLRLLVLPLGPALSDDLFRYLWEGRVLLHGFNPLLVPPASPVLDFLADGIRASVNHPEIPSIYPPLAQLLFALEAALFYHPLSPQLVGIAAEVCSMWALMRLLEFEGKSPRQLAFYAWNPLPIVEFAGSGHVDGVAIALLLWGLVWWRKPERLRGNPLISALLLTASALVKVLPGCLLPYLWLDQWRKGARRQAVLSILLSLSLAAALTLPFLDARGKVFEAARIYRAHWSFNPSLFALSTQLLTPEHARQLMLALFGLLLLHQLLRRPGLITAARESTQAFFLLSPTAHPWYLCWALPFQALHPSPAWILLSGTVGISYAVFAGEGRWQEHPLTPWLVYLPPLLCWLWTKRPGHSSPCG